MGYPYKDLLDPFDVVAMERMISVAIDNAPGEYVTEEEFSNGDGFEPYPQKACDGLAKEILYNVVRKLRPELLKEEESA